MSSPVVSASDTGNRSIFKSLDKMSDKPRQFCDLVLQIEKDLQLFIQLFNVKLSMLGQHQLKNAVTATCAALCLRVQGWRLSDESIRAGLESAFLLGRSQILTQNEAERLGLPGATILVDGAHTKESARALMNTMEMTFPKARLVLVVAMANDKDHLGFARELLSARRLEAVFLTEVTIAGAKSRTTSASSLRGSWIQASLEMGIDILDYSFNQDQLVKDLTLNPTEKAECQALLFAEGSLMASIKAGNKILGARTRGGSGVIIVTGSLHIVSGVLISLEG
ncbi:hypothetical protein ACH5RR_017221 [Cinchona calisaya]|uniref:Mur ligase C-terminal domain-containing protein n=1 Tax=Cinchona calisaya TaxID=153742 RepID=A0ABD3A1T7_9GENT